MCNVMQWMCLLSCMQKLYTVCDVAMHIIMSKSTTYSLESPKDPLLPPRFFTKPDKVGVSTLKNVVSLFFSSHFLYSFMDQLLGRGGLYNHQINTHKCLKDAQAAFLKGFLLL